MNLFLSKLSRTILIIPVFVIITGSFSKAQGPVVLSLDECIEYAFENNPNMMNAELEIEKQRKVVGETLSIGFPQVSGNLDLRNNFEVPTSFIPGEFFGNPGQFVPIQFSPQFGGNASVGMTQMVFNGSYIVGVQAAKVFVELSTKQSKMTKIDVAQAVTTAFYSVLVNEEGLDLVNDNYNRLDSLLRETQLMFENGFAEKIDVNRVKVQYNNSVATRKSTIDLVELSKKMLKFQMGMPIETEVELEGSLNDLANELSNPVIQEFEYGNRIEYSILQTQENLVLFQMKNNKAQYYPKLDFYLNLGATSAGIVSGDLFDTNNWFGLGNYGLTLNLPIFDGLYKSYRIQQNKISLDQIKNEYDLIKNSIDLEIVNSKINLENAIINFNTQKENMALSQEVYNVTKVKYQEGLGSNLEVIEADADYKVAQNNYYNSMYQVLISKVELEKALGTLYQ